MNSCVKPFALTNFRLFHSERVCRRQFQMMKMARNSPNGWKNCGKKRNCSLRAISRFPAVFPKDLYFRYLKPGLVCERVDTRKG